MSEATEDPRTYFAAERTFLAWIRTGLGLMGVGFAVARFGLFLREMQAGHGPAPVSSAVEGRIESRHDALEDEIAAR